MIRRRSDHGTRRAVIPLPASINLARLGKFFSVDVQPLLPPGISPRRMTIAARKIIEVLPLAASKYKLAEPPPPPRGTRDSKFHRLRRSFLSERRVSFFLPSLSCTAKIRLTFLIHTIGCVNL